MLVLGIEISPAGTKAVVLDLESSSIAAEAWTPHVWTEGLPAGYREQEPAKWLVAADQSVRQCLSLLGRDRSQITALGVTGPLKGMVLLDKSNRIVRAAKLAGDVTTQRQAEELARGFGGAPGLIELTGHCPGADSAAAECLWLKQHEPAYFDRAVSLLTVQDFMAWWLTGTRGTTPASASATGLYDIRRQAWSGELLGAIDPRLGELLPPVGRPEEARGLLRGDLARNWGLGGNVLVAAGGAAPMMMALAAGCVGHGTAAMHLGAEATVLGCGGQPVVDLLGELSAYCNASGGWLGMAVTNSTAVAPEVVRRHYGWSMERFEEMAAKVPAGADGLLMLPYVNGERTPRLRDGSGVLHGISPDNFTAGHLARATLEGVALGLGYALSRLRDLGLEPEEIRLVGTGGGPLLRQLLADVTGLPVVPLAHRLDAAAGAATHAAVTYFHHHGAGLGFGEIAKYLVEAGERPAEPDLRLHPLYQTLLSRQQYLVETLFSAGFL